VLADHPAGASGFINTFSFDLGGLKNYFKIKGKYGGLNTLFKNVVLL